MDDSKVDRFPSPVGMLSPQTAMILGRLRRGRPGDFVGDDELAALTNLEVGDSKYYSKVRTAIRQCIRSYGKVWSRVFREHGLKCLNDQEIVEEVSARMPKRHRKLARTHALMLSAVNAEELDEEAKNTLVALQRLSNLYHDLSSGKLQRAWIAAPPEKPLTVERLVDMSKRV